MNTCVRTFCSRAVTSCSDFTSLNLSSLICLLASPEESEHQKQASDVKTRYHESVFIQSKRCDKVMKTNMKKSSHGDRKTDENKKTKLQQRY